MFIFGRKGFTPTQIVLSVILLVVLLLIIAQIQGWLGAPIAGLENTFSSFGRRGGP
jgi:hypothetical protein